MPETAIRIKNMVSNCCLILLSERLAKHDIKFSKLILGLLILPYENKSKEEEKAKEIIESIGLGIIKDRDDLLVEEIKTAVIELIHQMNNVDSVVRKSDYLVEKLGQSYQHLSKVFSVHENITLEKYIILQKIERIKELIDSDEYTLSEISYMMDYSSVQYLSTQFKSITGITVTEYKTQKTPSKNAIENL